MKRGKQYPRSSWKMLLAVRPDTARPAAACSGVGLVTVVSPATTYTHKHTHINTHINKRTHKPTHIHKQVGRDRDKEKHNTHIGRDRDKEKHNTHIHT